MHGTNFIPADHLHIPVANGVQEVQAVGCMVSPEAYRLLCAELHSRECLPTWVIPKPFDRADGNQLHQKPTYGFYLMYANAEHVRNVYADLSGLLTFSPIAQEGRPAIVTLDQRLTEIDVGVRELQDERQALVAHLERQGGES